MIDLVPNSLKKSINGNKKAKNDQKMISKILGFELTTS